MKIYVRNWKKNKHLERNQGEGKSYSSVHPLSKSLCSFVNVFDAILIFWTNFVSNHNLNTLGIFFYFTLVTVLKTAQDRLVFERFLYNAFFP